MNTKLLLLLSLFTAFVYAQDVTTVEATDSDISDNLDLEAVASVFGEAKDLEDFEKTLNDPDKKLTNLDLNEDGEVDYLRVVESSKDETHLITIQAVLGKDKFQDVATIDVEKDGDETTVQVVGDVYMYGPDYVITPVYVHPPVFFVFFWGPYYNPWRSPFYWGYYPPYYRPWHPYPPHRYRTNVRVNVNINNSYHKTTIRKSSTAVNIQKDTRRNDFGSKNPDKSFEKRNQGVSNKQELTSKRKDISPKTSTPKTTPSKEATPSRKVDNNWKPKSGSTGNKVSVPNTGGKVPKGIQNANKIQTPKKSPSSVPKRKPSSYKATAPKMPSTSTRPSSPKMPQRNMSRRR